MAIPGTALITGASSGIGLELSRVFARRGHPVVLLARDEARLSILASELTAVYGGPATVLAADLSDPGAPARIVAELQRQEISVECLVNNAGFGTYGFFAEAEPDSQVQMLQVNVVALTHLTRLLLPPMLERRRGRILNVASTAAFQPGPLMAVYYASKAYVVWFTEALANELRGTGATATALCPGPTRTDFQRRAAMEASRLSSATVMDAAPVAELGYRAMMRGQTVAIPGLINRLFATLSGLTPHAITTPLVRRVQGMRE